MKLLRTETLFFLVIWLFFLDVGRSGFLRDPGTYWHTRVGEQAWAARRVPQTDTFSFTFGGERWQGLNWLSSCIMAGLHSISGFDTFVLATASILALLFTWIAHRTLRTGTHWTLVSLMAILLFLGTKYHYHARPHLATMVLLPWTYSRLLDWEADRILLVRLLWLIPGFWLWTNLHAGVLAGIATVGLIIGIWYLMALIGKSGPVAGKPRQAGALAAIFGCCLVALFIHPFGLNSLYQALDVGQSTVVSQYIIEHQPINPRSIEAMALFLLAMIFLVAMWSAIRRKVFRGSWLAPIPWFVLGMLHVRHAPLFAVTAMLAVVDIWPHTAAAARLAEQGSWLYRPQPESRSRAVWLVPAAAIVVALLLQAGGVVMPLIGAGWARPDRYWPTDLLPQLKKYEQANPGAPIFNDMVLGGYLIYHTPQLPIFIDDRCELYGDRFLLEYFDAEKHHPERIEEWSDQYGFSLAITSPDSGFAKFLTKSPEWEEIGGAPSAVLFRKKKRQ